MSARQSSTQPYTPFSRSRLPGPGIPYFQGECNDDVLAEIGVGAEQAEALRRQRAVLSRRNPVGAFD